MRNVLEANSKDTVQSTIQNLVKHLQLSAD